MPERSSSLRSWICAGVALLFGLGLYVYDDWCESLQVPLAKTILNYLEIIVMGPAMAVLAFLVSEWLRTKDLRYHQRLDEEKEKRFRFLGRIAASMAHEVRNPLHNLHLANDEIRHRAPADLQKVVAIATDNLARLEQATKLIYLLARPPKQQAGETLSPLELRPLLSDIIEELRRGSGGRVPMTLRLPATPVVANANHEAARMVLQNLIRNANEAAGSGEVEISAEDGSQTVTVHVRNPGEIPSDFLAEDSDATSRKPGGLGVGLSIARHLAASLGGRLTLTSGNGFVDAILELPKGT